MYYRISDAIRDEDSIRAVTCDLAFNSNYEIDHIGPLSAEAQANCCHGSVYDNATSGGSIPSLNTSAADQAQTDRVLPS
jgi:hypothetical protein